MTILQEIAQKRRKRIDASDHCLSARSVPERRAAPLMPFGRSPFLICEVKKRSPSRGNIRGEMDPVEQAGLYAEAGVQSVSVLTEEDYFGGSLDDLVAVKERYPDLSVLRKDFLLDEEDLELSYRAGADAVLLIATLLDEERLARLDARARELGLARLVEVHDEQDLEKARALEAPLLGINARDLTTFRVDRLTPLAVASAVDWECELVFESGLFDYEDAVFARDGGFSGILVGEAVVREPARIPRLFAGLTATAREHAGAGGHVQIRGEPPGTAGTDGEAGPQLHPRPEVAGPAPAVGNRRFWRCVAALGRDREGGPAAAVDAAGRRERPGRSPMVKICGITNREDAERAVELGADMLGFVFADSKRRARPELLPQLRELPVLKVAVVVADRAHGRLPPEVAQLLAEGLLDAVQLHGAEEPQECFETAYPYYKALRPQTPAEADRAAEYRSPRVLFDAFDRSLHGGTGKRLNEGIVLHIAEQMPLWLAGGLGPGNIREIVRRFCPELVDASSSLEAEPGRKDHAALQTYFEEIRYGCTSS